LTRTAPVLTNSALVCEHKCGGRGGVAGSQPMSTAVHRSPNKLWRSNSGSQQMSTAVHRSPNKLWRSNSGSQPMSTAVHRSPNKHWRSNSGSQPMSTAVHRSPNKHWRSNSIFNLCLSFTDSYVALCQHRLYVCP
jgi:hypothetical protein